MAEGNATAAGASGGPAAAAGHATATSSTSPDVVNKMLSHWLLIILGAFGGALLVWRLTTVLTSYVRMVSCLANDTQRYFAQSSVKVSWFKKNVLYSPMFGKRHNREFMLSKAINVGTLPTRLQFFLLLAYLATNVAFCVVTINFSGDYATTARLLRNRVGVLATVNMIPLFLFAGRNNPLIKLLGVSFDTYNLLHRWLGRIVILEALAHTIAHLAAVASKTGWSKAFVSMTTPGFLLNGLIAVCAFLAIGIQAASVFRHAFYETFKVLHICLAITAVYGLYMHLHLKGLPQVEFLWAAVALWIFDRAARLIRLGYHNIGSGGTKTSVEALPGNACRVTVTMARPWGFRPGQHAYLYMPTIGFWQSHPFSVAWSEEAEQLEMEKLPMDRVDVLSNSKTSISFIIRGRTGFTGSLYDKAAACPGGHLTTTCFVEGPYGGHHGLRSYGTVVLFAGGVGITQAVPHCRDLVAGYSNGTVAARKVVLVWIIQNPEHLEWIRPWMTQILAMEKRRDVLRIMLFISRPHSSKEVHSPSATVQMFPGRPNIDTLIGLEMENQVGTLGVTVCGPGALSDEVRRAVRNRQYNGAIDFIEEAFSW